MGGTDKEPRDTGAVSDFVSAVSEAELPIGLIDLSDETVKAVSKEALRRLGLPASAVVGHPASNLVREEDRAAAEEGFAALRRGVLDYYVARRGVHTAIGSEPLTRVWHRAFSLGDRRLVLSQAAGPSLQEHSPLGDHLGFEPVRMAIGTINGDFTVTAISRDIHDMLGVQPDRLVGHRLLEKVARNDVSALVSANAQLGDRSVGLTIHLRNADGEWIAMCCVLTLLVGNPDRCFILIPEPEPSAERSRIAELEQHLWAVAAIIEASGVLQRVGPMRDMTALPQVNNLTTRQWEVLARIARGERVPTIAADLHLSQSTVRNHLAAIFKRFGVHSQPELLQALAAAPARSPN